MNLIFLDTETTGLKDGRVVQVAYKISDSNTLVAEYFKPPVPIDIEAMAVHHITEKKVLDKQTFKDSKMFKDLAGFLKDSILVAHNAPYDITILANEGITSGKFICTYKIAYHIYDLPNYKMQYLRYLWNIDEDSALAHSAEGDVVILEKVFSHMLEEYSKNNNLTHEQSVNKFIEISSTPQLQRKITFGKHIGKTFEEIKKNDPSYLNWLHNNALADKSEDFVYTVKHYMGL